MTTHGLLIVVMGFCFFSWAIMGVPVAFRADRLGPDCDDVHAGQRSVDDRADLSTAWMSKR